MSQEREGLGRIDLLSSIAARIRSIGDFLLCNDIEFAEDLFDGLNAFGLKTVSLPLRPFLADEEIVRVGDSQELLLADRFEFSVIIPKCPAFFIGITHDSVADEDQPGEQRPDEGMRGELD